MTSPQPEQTELVDEFCHELSKWLQEFENIQPWEMDGEISDEKWDEYRAAVHRLLKKANAVAYEKGVDDTIVKYVKGDYTAGLEEQTQAAHQSGYKQGQRDAKNNMRTGDAS